MYLRDVPQSPLSDYTVTLSAYCRRSWVNADFLKCTRLIKALNWWNRATHLGRLAGQHPILAYRAFILRHLTCPATSTDPSLDPMFPSSASTSACTVMSSHSSIVDCNGSGSLLVSGPISVDWQYFNPWKSMDIAASSFWVG